MHHLSFCNSKDLKVLINKHVNECGLEKIGNKSIIPTIAAETIKWLCEILVTTTAYLHTVSVQTLW